MRKIDNIRGELERGYILIISGIGSKSYGSIRLQPHQNKITAYEEVEVNNIMKHMPNIKEVLGWYQNICQVSYDYETRKILGQIKKMQTEGPYCEQWSYEVVDDFEVRSDDILMALIELNDKIAKKDIAKNKEKIKAKNGE